MSLRHLRIVAVAALLASLTLVQLPSHAQFSPGPSPESAFSIPKAQQLQPEELSRLLHGQVANKPLIFQVGSHMLFAQAHIVGSEYMGPGSQPAGLKLLQDRVSPLPRKTFIVIYCGCCPWERCPNMGPAYKLLHDMGFTNVKALYLANNLGADWVSKGYPVESGR